MVLVVTKQKWRQSVEETRAFTLASVNPIMNLATRTITAAVLFQSLLLAFGPSRACAADLFWSGDGTTEGGAGTWDTNNMRFGTLAAGPFSTIWTNANSDNAIF